MTAGSTLRLWLRPGMLLLHILGIAAVTFCIIGGFWQLGVYDQRQEDERADRQQVPTVPLSQVWTAPDGFTPELNHRPVLVAGQFAPDGEQMWVSGREQEGRDGFWLLSPLVMESGDALLVVRGFAPGGGVVPEFPATPDGPVELEVVLSPGESAAHPLDADRVIGSVRIPSLVNELPYRLFPGFGISTDAEAPGGLDRVVTPTPEVSWTVGMRNLAYSLQWWVFGLFAAFMWWRMCVDQVAATRASAEANRRQSLVADVDVEREDTLST